MLGQSAEKGKNARRTHCGQCWEDPRIRRGIPSELATTVMTVAHRVAITGYTSFLQPLFFAGGLLILGLAWHLSGETS